VVNMQSTPLRGAQGNTVSACPHCHREQ
jgi:hypothetical protein